MLGRTCCISVLSITLGSCAVVPEPLTVKDRDQQIFLDLAERFSNQHPPDGPLTLHQATAYAIRNNLSHRVKVMEEVLAHGMDRVVSQRMLPRLAADAGYTTQDRLSPLADQLSNQTRDLTISWNVLDFGVSYMSAKQQADRTLIAAQLRRKATHTLIQEIRTTFWRAIAAERLSKTIAPLKIKLRAALDSARAAEEERIEAPIPVLDFQVTLLETLQKLQKLERELSSARINLAELMGLDPGYPFILVEPEPSKPINLKKLPPIEALERYALQHRPELWERDYQRRIKAYATKKAILRLLPGLEFSQSENYDDTESDASSLWAEFGVKLTWNLLNLLTGPDKISLAQDKERLEDFRRMALNMTVLAQVHVALRNLTESYEAFTITSRLNEVKERLRHHSEAAQKADTLNELQLISREGEHIIFLTRRDLAFAQLQNTTGLFYVSLGVDSMPDIAASMEQKALADMLTKQSETIKTGKIPDLILDFEPRKKEPKTVMGQKNQAGAVVTEWTIKKAKKPSDAGEAADSPEQEIEKPAEEIPAEAIPAEEIPAEETADSPEQTSKTPAENGATHYEVTEPEATVVAGDQPAPPLKETDAPLWVVRVGVFSQPLNVKNLLAQLTSWQIPTFQHTIQRRGKPAQTVYAGPLVTLAEAQTVTVRLHQEIGIETLLFSLLSDGSLEPVKLDYKLAAKSN